tara:strand:- start:374 stop:505 length:132 start_codon:yes stop_codon:yes gene_type:complete
MEVALEEKKERVEKNYPQEKRKLNLKKRKKIRKKLENEQWKVL